MDKFIPATGDKGFFRVAPPFFITENEIYTCKAIRTISEFISLGVDPFAEYYEPNGLSVDDYDAHQNEDMEIISLVNDGGHWVHFPAAYLLGYPNMNGIPYRSMAIMVTLPPFPVDQPYEFVEAQIKDTVQQTLGVGVKTARVIVTKTKLLESDKHEALKTSRIVNSTGSTPRAQAAYWRNSYEDLKLRYDALIDSMT